MTAGVLECSLHLLGDCEPGGVNTAMPGDTICWEFVAQNNSLDEVVIAPSVHLPVMAPDSTVELVNLFGGAAPGPDEGCVTLPCGGCAVWKITTVVAEDEQRCLALTPCVDTEIKLDETALIRYSDAKTGTTEKTVTLKNPIKQSVGETVFVNYVNPEADVCFCPKANGKRDEDIQGLMQYMSGEGCGAVQLMDAKDSGVSFLELIALQVLEIVEAGDLPALSVSLTKTDLGEAIQGVDLDNDGDIGTVDVTEGDAPPPPPAPAPANPFASMTVTELQDLLRAADLPVSGTKDELIARLEAN